MREKDLQIGVLLDFYGAILPERKRLVLDLYYNNDYSLSEISEEIGITRQGVLDTIKKGSDSLLFYEEKLGLYEKFQKAESALSHIESLMANEENIPDNVKEDIRLIIKDITF